MDPCSQGCELWWQRTSMVFLRGGFLFLRTCDATSLPQQRTSTVVVLCTTLQRNGGMLFRHHLRSCLDRVFLRLMLQRWWRQRRMTKTTGTILLRIVRRSMSSGSGANWNVTTWCTTCGPLHVPADKTRQFTIFSWFIVKLKNIFICTGTKNYLIFQCCGLNKDLDSTTNL